MEPRQYALERFIFDVTTFFTEKFPNLTHILLPLKKHTLEKTKEEFRSKFYDKEDAIVASLNDVFTLIHTESQSWCLPVGKILVNENFVSLTLARSSAFRTVLAEILNSNGKYGEQISNSQFVRISKARDTENDDLSDYRLQILAKTAENLMQAGGYTIVDNEEEHAADIKLYFGIKGPTDPSVIWVVSNYVLDEMGKKNELSLKDYLKMREDDMRAMGKHKYSRETTIKTLAEAALAIDMLQVRSKYPLRLNTQESVAYGIRESTSKGATFLNYNYARLATILKKFEIAVTEGLYPTLPPIDDLDTSTLNQQDEWILLFDYLIEYPRMLAKTIEQCNKGEINQNSMCSFMFKLCHSLSVFYRHVQVLQEPKAHLIATVHARVALVKAIKEVMEHGMKILNVSPVECM